MADDRLYDRRTVLGMTVTGALGGMAGCTGDGGGGDGDGTTRTATSTPTGTDTTTDESTPTTTESGGEELTGCQGFEAEMVPYEPPENGLVAAFEYPDFPNARLSYDVEQVAGVANVSVNIANSAIAVLLNQNTGSSSYAIPTDAEDLTEITFNGETVEVKGKLREGTPTAYEWFLVVPFDGNEYTFENRTRHHSGDAGAECQELLRTTAANIAETFSVRPDADPPS